MHWNRDSHDQIAICRWHIAATSSKTGCYLNFCPSPARAKMQTSPFRCTKKTRYRMVPGLFAYCRMGAKGRPDRRAGKKCPVETFLVHGRVQRRKTAFCRSAGFLLFVYVGALGRSSKRDPFAVPGGNFACRSRLASCRPLHTLRPRLLCHRQRSGSRSFRCTATARAKHNSSCPILLLVVS